MQVEKSLKFVKVEDIKGIKDVFFTILEESIKVQGTYGAGLPTFWEPSLLCHKECRNIPLLALSLWHAGPALTSVYL